MGRHPSPRYGQVILVSGYLVMTAVNWSQHWCAICLQYQSFCAPKLARKCEIKHWLACGADGRAGGRAGGRAVYGHVITKFSGMGRFTYPWCSAGELRAPELRYQLIVVIQLLMVSFGPMISFGGVFMGMTMIHQLLLVVVMPIFLNKIGQNYTLIIRNRSCRYFTLHIFTHCLLSFKRGLCKRYVRFSRI